MLSSYVFWMCILLFFFFQFHKRFVSGLVEFGGGICYSWFLMERTLTFSFPLLKELKLIVNKLLGLEIDFLFLFLFWNNLLLRPPTLTISRFLSHPIWLFAHAFLMCKSKSLLVLGSIFFRLLCRKD